MDSIMINILIFLLSFSKHIVFIGTIASSSTKFFHLLANVFNHIRKTRHGCFSILFLQSNQLCMLFATCILNQMKMHFMIF
jgi:hypothetical protein